MNRIAIPFVIILALGVFLATQALFTVDQTEQAIVLQLGQPKGAPRGPGLHAKIPFIQNVRYFDRRVLSVDPGAEQMVIASASIPGEKPPSETPPVEGEAPVADAPTIDVTGEPIIVDTFARYKITDPLQFMKTLGTIYNANSRIQNILSDATKTVLAKTSLQDLLSSQRAAVMAEIRDRVNRNTHQDALGIEIVDVRIVRADLTAALLTSTVQRMKSELKERATETRAEGEEQALEIRSTADKERSVILAEGERDAQILRGEGDKEAIKIYAEAFNKDKDFYAFMRSMEAYKNTLADPETRLILSPKSDFFRFFENYRSGTP